MSRGNSHEWLRPCDTLICNKQKTLLFIVHSFNYFFSHILLENLFNNTRFAFSILFQFLLNIFFQILQRRLHGSQSFNRDGRVTNRVRVYISQAFNIGNKKLSSLTSHKTYQLLFQMTLFNDIEIRIITPVSAMTSVNTDWLALDRRLLWVNSIWLNIPFFLKSWVSYPALNMKDVWKPAGNYRLADSTL